MTDGVAGPGFSMCFGPIYCGPAWRNTWFTCQPSGVFFIPFRNTCEWFQATV